MDSQIRYAYRYVPNDRLYTRIGLAVMALGGGIYVTFQSQDWRFLPAGFVVALLIALSIGFLRTVSFVVNNEGLVIVRQSLFRFGGSYSFYGAKDIRRIRFRSFTHVDIGRREWEGNSFCLDMITIDSQIHHLVASEDIPVAPELGKHLAESLGVDYEEHLEARKPS